MMASQAFPCPHAEAHPGLTKRQAYAVEIAAGLATNAPNQHLNNPYAPAAADWAQKVAHLAWLMADWMIWEE